MIKRKKLPIIKLVDCMKKRKYIIYILLLFFLLITTKRIIDICVFENESYKKSYEATKNRYVHGSSAPRGRILDVNGKVLVDNIGINSIIYNRTDSSNIKEEVIISKRLGEVLKFPLDKATTYRQKTFYLALHGGCDDLITDEERKLKSERKLSTEDINTLKYERITEEMLSDMGEDDINASYIYYLLSNGFYYEDKVIARHVSNEDIVKIVDMNLPGIRVELSWERTYPYGETLKTLFGTISTNGVPKEYKDYYEKKGIAQNSTVGISFLEFYYDDYLRGTDAVYKLSSKGKPVLVSDAIQGNDLYLSIDIDVQQKIEEILKTEMLNAKKAPKSDFYNHSYVIIGHPKTGEIVAAVGLEINKGNFVDVTANMIHSSYTVGSIVKGATISVGYQQNLIKKGQKVLDSCIKVYGVTKKCSWTSLGWIDEISALAQSSNYYQFLIATRLTNPKYTWNSHLNAKKEHFDIYRNMLSSYGLGALTGIDLPNEQQGIQGKRVSDDLLLNLTIGQYDTYTPIEIFQYINTLANDGTRIAPSLMKKIAGPNIYIENEPKILNKVNLATEDIKRIQQGFRQVIAAGTGRSYTNGSIPAAGKTGTAETFVDSNGDGIMDKSTTSASFIMYAPFENPEYSIVIMSPNIGHDGYKYSINMRINRKIFKYLFENSKE